MKPLVSHSLKGCLICQPWTPQPWHLLSGIADMRKGSGPEASKGWEELWREGHCIVKLEDSNL